VINTTENGFGGDEVAAHRPTLVMATKK